jgi:hypothetical protein
MMIDDTAMFNLVMLTIVANSVLTGANLMVLVWQMAQARKKDQQDKPSPKNTPDWP